MNRILDTINQPQDIQHLSFPKLEELAGEIRELVIHTVARNGGHLASNLGVVELTVALHKVFNSPVDKFVWDVGHQAYIHKILTGRRDSFDTLRKWKGISGFPCRDESDHDTFGTGHSSTSISAALGMAVARDLRGEKHHVVAIIGDGSFTGGQAYEGINQAGQLRTNLTVILNDNEMSIAKNVGAVSEILAKMRTAPTYSKVKQDIEMLLRRIPAIGENVAKTALRMKDSLKYLLVPGMLFEQLGFTYLGPIDGHNLEVLTEVLQKAKNISGPVLIHTLTCKGKGYSPAEYSADKFHGVGPFCVENGEVIRSSGNGVTYTGVFADAIIELAEENTKIVTITAAMPEGTGLKKFASRFPERFFDVGIAEPHAVSMAAGLATQGLRPVVAIYSTFLQRAYDHIMHDVCLQKLPVIFAIDRAGIVGDDGATHHGLFDISYLRHIPNLTVMIPKDENELRHMLRTALQHDGPVAIRYPRGQGVGVPLDKDLIQLPIGKAERIKAGNHVSIWAVGAMVTEAYKTSEELEREWAIQAEVINARFVKPFDLSLLKEAVHNTELLVTMEENVRFGGFGSSLLEYLNGEGLVIPPCIRFAFPDQFIEHGSRNQLMEQYGLTPKLMAVKIAEALGRKLREHE